MEYVIVGIAAIFASGLTFFSGFGLGSIMLPVFLLVLTVEGEGKVELAISLTAIVHLLNNIFKISLVGRDTNFKVLLRFGLPAMAAAFAGAWVLGLMNESDTLLTYEFLDRSFDVTLINVTIGVLMVIFAMFELIPKLRKWNLGPEWLIPGGVLSGFFGGLSGHQGALRSAFLIKAGLTKEQFIATGIAIACLVDVARLGLYSQKFFNPDLQIDYWLLATAVLCAFAGAVIGKKLVKKVTLKFLQILVGVLLIAIALGLISGILAK